MATISLVELNHDMTWNEDEMNFYRQHAHKDAAPYYYMRVINVRHSNDKSLITQYRDALVEAYIILSSIKDSHSDNGIAARHATKWVRDVEALRLISKGAL